MKITFLFLIKNANKLVLMLCLLFIYSSVEAQESASIVSKTNTIVGTSMVLHSKVLDQDLEIQISLPKKYHENPSKAYPVLYLLEGQKWFLYTTSLQHIFGEDRITPEFIVVGITTEWVKEGFDKQRRDFFDANAKQFMTYIEKDVIGFIDNNYRTTTVRMLSGWQWAGSFMLETLIHKTSLFDAYFIGNYIPTSVSKGNETLKGLNNLFLNAKDIKPFLYFNTSLLESQNNRGGFHKLKNFLSQKAPQNFKWAFSIIDYEGNFMLGHRDSSLDAISKGLRSFYFDYSSRFILNKEDYDDYTKKGGLHYVKDYYNKRAKRYSLENEKLNSRTILLSINVAISRNDFSAFELLMDAYKKEILEARMRSGHAKIGDFYLKYNQTDKALEIFKAFSVKYANKAEVFFGLGMAYHAKSNYSEAKKAFQKAVELAEKNSNPKLEDYKMHLENINR